MRITAVLLTILILSLGACGGGCDVGKMKDKAMEYKDKVPTEKIPSKMP